ncbi:hypothetical protein OWT26_15185 [Burkholderia sp. 1A5]
MRSAISATAAAISSCRFRLPRRNATGRCSKWRCAALYDRVVQAGGCFSAEHGVGPVNIAYYRKHVPAAQRQLAGAVQHAIDPLGLVGRVRY